MLALRLFLLLATAGEVRLADDVVTLSEQRLHQLVTNIVDQRLDQAKLKWQEERQTWRREKQNWQKEELHWLQEKSEWQKEKLLYETDREEWQREKQEWVLEKLQWQREKQEWQQEKQEWQQERWFLKMQMENLQQKTDQMQTHVLSTKHKLAIEKTLLDRNQFKTSQPVPDPVPESTPFNTTSSDTDINFNDLHPRSDHTNALEGVVAQMDQRLNDVGAAVQALKNTDAQHEQAIVQAGSTTFVRWGRSVCPNSTQLVYTGVVGGGYWDKPGSSTTVLCLPLNPVQGDIARPSDVEAELFGAEYSEAADEHYDKDPVCAVCQTHGRPLSLVLPATTACPNGWTLDYSGYLMGSYPKDPAGHDFVCVDSALEARIGSERNEDGLKLFYTYTQCGSLPCPPYEDNKHVTCALCSK